MNVRMLIVLTIYGIKVKINASFIMNKKEINNMIINIGNYEEINVNDAMREVIDVFIKFNIKTSDDKKDVLRACHIYNQLRKKGIIK